jgi:hypothetical protein
MKDNGQTALSRQTEVAIFALPIIVTSEELCDASKAAIGYLAGYIMAFKSVRVSATSNSAADAVMVYADCSFPIYIPIAFTPN